MALTYVIGASMFFSGDLGKKRNTGEAWPLLVPFLLILMAFVLSWTQANSALFNANLFYLVMLSSNAVLFYMTYHYIRNESDFEWMIKLLIISNLLVIGYCILQIFIGFGKFSFLGLQELSLTQNRSDNRLVGPFDAVGITAEYLVIQCIIIAHHLFSTKKHFFLSIFIIFSNLAILIGTGNRGGFISLFLAIFLFLIFFGKVLGLKKVISIFIGTTLFLAMASYIMITYTKFNVLYTRLAKTEIHGITPDTRAGWDVVVDKIKNKPILGHTPRYVTSAEKGVTPSMFQGQIDFYPHNLYLFILYTLGITGFAAYCSLWFKYFTGFAFLKLENANNFTKGLKKIGIIIFLVFLFDQLKVEFLRYYLLDFQHYIATLAGIFYGLRKFNSNNANIT